MNSIPFAICHPVRVSLAFACALILSACTSLSGVGFRLGETSPADVEAKLGQPAIRWEDNDGSLNLIYPTGPSGTATYAARFSPAPARRLKAYENLLDISFFARIQAGMGMQQVQRIVGPPYQPWTTYFKSRDELVWEWRYCDAWGEAARFYVLFDGTTRLVRSTMSLTEGQQLGSGRNSVPCGRVAIQVGGVGYRSP